MEKKKVYVAPECEKVFMGLYESVALPVGTNYDGDNFSKKYNQIGDEFDEEFDEEFDGDLWD